ncbi:DNA-directed RNA polymerase subunit alpha [Candidatus Cytomitobacter primus]|uniref:DNA-directed RNA polymerase subunit alpha n=1 Tax=Candidatus Cytomitobacter primus TaxID=2066024 RepID=A0A5C0UF78_9PROT|nr:DNA-directed RNA polymerase subunit alpha [Candidatus Cytomitobacter primus]QEK38718.1 DNA-directed RNA polymerase subunit alpha [Candidatus Cytomitobacter primus]
MSDIQNSNEYVFGPLEPGYGITFGNAVRRILLSSIKGLGLVGFKIKGVNNIFSSINGVSEDVEYIAVNLKKIVFKSDLEEFSMTLNAKGGKVDASMFDSVPGVEILNPEQYICNLSDSADISIEIFVQSGKGYVSSDMLEVPEGFIKLDSAFSPIERVSYNVKDMRVGQKTDYDQLSFNIKTNGSVDSYDALMKAFKILKDQSVDLMEKDDASDEEVEEVEVIADARWNDEIASSLQLSKRAQNVISNLKFIYIGDLITATEKDLFSVAGCGRTTVDEIRSVLQSKYKFDLDTKIEDWSEIRPKGMVL